ncbi:MAG: hypothetical protein FWC89_08795 [Defluviitaleaceae bacterium]|nr:hypothetical protein [Defluviitaleaceae bacterium]
MKIWVCHKGKIIALSAAFLILFSLLTAVTACSSITNLPEITVETIYEPIEGVSDSIIASGYIEINNSRYSAAPPSAVFHPYPSYFHLFPFAISDGANLPVFVLTNDVDEIFDFLGKTREDVQTDRFGNQKLDNVSAVFDNFSKRRLFIGNTSFGVDIVRAEMINIVEDENQDFWEIEQADFVLITNGDRTIEPVALRIGEEFLGLLLTRIESSQVYMKNGELYHQLSAEAEFNGQIALGGDLTIRLHFDSDYRVEANFAVASEYLSLLPRIADFGVCMDVIRITNPNELMLALGITRSELDAARNIEVEELLIVFDISWISSFGYVTNFIELRGISQ